MRYLRLLRLGGLLVVALAAVLVFTHYRTLLDYTAKVLSLELSAWTGERVTIEHLDVRLLELSISAEGIRVDSLAHPGSPPIARIPSLTVRLGAVPRKGRLHIRSIELDAPVISLHLSGGQPVEFQDLFGAGGPGEEGEAPSQARRIDIDRIVLEDATVQLDDSVAGWRTAFSGLDLEMGLVDGKPARMLVSHGRVHVTADGVDQTLDDIGVGVVLSGGNALVRGLRIQWTGGRITGDGQARLRDGRRLADAHLNLRLGVDLSSLPGLVPGLPEMTGRLQFRGAIDYAQDWSATGRVSFEGAKVDIYECGDGEAQVEITREGIRATRGRLTMPRGLVSFEGFLGFGDRLPLQVGIDFDRVRVADVFEAVSLKDPWVDMGLSGRVRAEGFLEGPFGLKGHARLRGRGFDVWDESFRTADAESLILELKTVFLDVDFSVDDTRVHLARAQLKTPGSHLYLEGDIRFDESLSLVFDAVQLDLNDVCPLAGIEIGGKGWGKGTVEGPFAGLLFDADLRLFHASFDDYYLGEVAGRFVVPLASTRFLLAHMNPGRRKGAAEPRRMSPLPREDTDLDTLATRLLGLDDTYYRGEMATQDPPVLMLPSGHLTIGRTHIDGALVVVFASPMTIYGDVTLSAGRPDQAGGGRLVDLLRIVGVEVPEGTVEGTVHGRATVHGDPDALNGAGILVLDRAVLADQPLDRAEMRFRLDAGDLLVDEFTAYLGGGRLSAGGSIGASGELEGKAVLGGLPLESLSMLSTIPLQGRLDADLVFDGNLDSPGIRGSVFLTQGAYAGTRVEDTVLTLVMVDDVLDVQGMVLGQYGRLSASVAMAPGFPLSATLELRDLPLDPFLGLDAVPGYSVDSHLSGVLWASAQLAGDVPPHIIAQLDGFSLSHSGFSVHLAEPTTLEQYRGRWHLEPLRLIGDDTDLRVSGDILEDDTVAMEVEGYFDLFFLDAVIPGLFQRLDGRMTLSGLESGKDDGPFVIAGTTDAFVFQGVARLSQAAISTEYFPSTIDQVSARIVVTDGNVVEIETLEGEVGGGSLAGRGRLVLGDDYYPRFYDLEVTAKDAFVQYLTDLPPGLMDADLAFRGPVDNLLMSGDVYLKRMVYRERYNWEKYLTDFRTYRLEDLEPVVEESPYFALDIRIHAPGTFFIRNNLGQMQFKGELQVTGDTNVVQLYGEIESVRGTVTLLDNTFDLTQAKIEFTGDYWNPKLDIRLQTQIQSYTIYYLVTGTLEDWHLIPGSDSGLSERDINSLIAFGTLADNITEGNEARAVAAPALEFLIGRLGVLEQLQAFTRLDRFTIIPASDEAGNIGARVYGEKDLVPDKFFFSGYYDYAVNGTPAFLMNLEWRAFDCCSLILRLDGSDTVGATSVRPGLRLRLKLELQ